MIDLNESTHPWLPTVWSAYILAAPGLLEGLLRKRPRLLSGAAHPEVEDALNYQHELLQRFDHAGADIRPFPRYENQRLVARRRGKPTRFLHLRDADVRRGAVRQFVEAQGDLDLLFFIGGPREEDGGALYRARLSPRNQIRWTLTSESQRARHAPLPRPRRLKPIDLAAFMAPVYRRQYP